MNNLELEKNKPTREKVLTLFEVWFKMQGNKISWKEFLNNCGAVPDVMQDDAFLNGFAEGYKWHASISASTPESPEERLS